MPETSLERIHRTVGWCGHENLEEEIKIATRTTRPLERTQVDGPRVAWDSGG